MSADKRCETCEWLRVRGYGPETSFYCGRPASKRPAVSLEDVCDRWRPAPIPTTVWKCQHPERPSCEDCPDVRLCYPLELVASGDVAKRAGVTANAVVQWIRRYDDTPTPVARTSAGAIWNWKDWELWLRRRGRLE